MEMLRADKKAYYFVDPNITEKINTFNSVPYFANAVISANSFQKTLDYFEEKYKNDKYMSRYIKYNRKIANYYSEAFQNWYHYSFEFLHRIAKDEYYYFEHDKKVDIEKNNLRYFDTFKSLDGIIRPEHRKEAFSKYENFSLLPSDSAISEIDNKYYNLLSQGDFDYSENEEIKTLYSEFKSAYYGNKPINALSIMLVFRRYLADSHIKHLGQYQTAKTISQLESAIDSAIKMSTEKLISTLATKTVTVSNNDYKLHYIPKRNDTPKENTSIFNAIKKWWDNL